MKSKKEKGDQRSDKLHQSVSKNRSTARNYPAACHPCAIDADCNQGGSSNCCEPEIIIDIVCCCPKKCYIPDQKYHSKKCKIIVTNTKCCTVDPECGSGSGGGNAGGDNGGGGGSSGSGGNAGDGGTAGDGGDNTHYFFKDCTFNINQDCTTYSGTGSGTNNVISDNNKCVPNNGKCCDDECEPEPCADGCNDCCEYIIDICCNCKSKNCCSKDKDNCTIVKNSLVIINNNINNNGVSCKVTDFMPIDPKLFYPDNNSDNDYYTCNPTNLVIYNNNINNNGDSNCGDCDNIPIDIPKNCDDNDNGKCTVDGELSITNNNQNNNRGCNDVCDCNYSEDNCECECE